MKQFQFIVYGLFFFLGTLSAQETIIPSESIFKVLQHSEVVEVTIETDLDSLINFRRRDSYQPAQFVYEDKNGESITRALKVKPRGKYRRKVCDFPTVKLNFSKKELKAHGMLIHDDYKLVTHCLDDKKESQENVLREYLIYKMYNVLSPNSFNVQYLNITYIDSKKKVKDLKRVGFLIEDTGELSQRMGAKIYRDARLPMDSFNMEQYNFVALFQYMIGNVDFRISPYAKNIKIMKYPEKDFYEVIPYDFDFSGIVQTSYTRLATHLQQKSVEQRIFLGNISDINDLKEAFTFFEYKKEELMDCINDFELLPKASRKKIKKYIESFYDDIENRQIAKVE